MNDFGHIERELKKLRPIPPSAGLISRVASDLSPTSASKVIRPQRFQVNWLGLGLGLAAAATFLILAQIDFHPAKKNSVASVAPTLEQKSAQLPNYQAAGLTQVVYERRDEGLIFPPGAQQPLRRLRTAKREILHWQDRSTGAQLQVSYPAEEIRLVPVSGQ